MGAGAAPTHNPIIDAIDLHHCNFPNHPLTNHINPHIIHQVEVNRAAYITVGISVPIGLGLLCYGFYSLATVRMYIKNDGVD